MSQTGYMFFLKKFVKPHLLSLSILLFFSFLGSLFSFINPLITKSLIDNVFIGKNTTLLVYIVLGFISLYLISATSNYYYNYLTGKLQVVMLKEVSENALIHIQRASIKSTEDLKVGDLITRIIGNTQMAINIPVHIVPQIIISIISIFIPFIIMFYLDMELSFIVMSPIVLFSLSSIYLGRKMEKRQKAFLEDNASIYSFLKEKISIIPLIKVFGLETWSQNKFGEKIDDYSNSFMEYTKISSLNISMGNFILGVPIILILIFGVPMVLNGSLSIGTFTAFLSYTSIFFPLFLNYLSFGQIIRVPCLHLTE